MSLPVFELRLLGGVDLRAPGGEPACEQILAQSRRTALLAYLRLAARDRLASRDTLHGIFWPELSQSRARRALNQSLYFLRHRMGDDVFLTDGPSLIGVNPARVSCDADEFETRVQADDLAAALDSYSGVLFDGFHLSGVPDFERWLDRERERLRGVVRTAAWTLIERHRERRELVEAIHWGRWLRQFEPYDEALMSCLLDLLEAAGDRSAIKREMRSFETRLQQDLGYTPSEAMVERVETILTAGNHRVVDPSVYARVDEVTHATAEQESIGGPGRPSGPGPRRWWPAFPVGLAAIVAVIALWTRTVSSERNPPPANGRRVAVLPFRNETGDSTLDYLERVAADWTRQRLVQMGLVEVVPSIITFQTVLDIPSVPASESSSLATSESFAVATATGASVVVLGSITRTGDTLIFSGSAEDPNLGRVVGVVKPVRVARDEPLEGIEQVAQHLAGTMAALVSPNMAGWAEKGSRPPTLEAYRRFDAAMERFLSASSVSAEAPEVGAAFAEAALPDEGFTSPLVWSVIANMYHGQWREAATTSEILAHHLDDLPAWDRAVLEYAQARLSDDLPAAYVALRHVVEFVSAPEWRELLALYAFFNRRPHEALSEFRRQNPIPSRLVGNRRNWEASAYHLTGDYETELRMTQRDGLSIRAKEGIELRARVGLGETRWVLREALARLQPPGGTTPDVGYSYSAMGELRAHRQSAAADTLLVRLNAWYDSTGVEELNGGERDRAGMVRLLAGRDVEALDLFGGGTRYAQRIGTAIAAQRLGDTATVRKMESALERNLDQPPTAGEPYVGLAAIAAHRGDIERAMTLLREAYRNGLYFTPGLHTRLDLSVLRGVPAFEDWLEPIG